MGINQIIIFIMAVSLLVGAFDAVRGNQWGLGEEFEAGFKAMGPLGLGMAGMICLAPVIASVLSLVMGPLFETVGSDPSMFASLLAIDMGGFALAQELANTPEASLFSGVIISSMLGCTLVFSIPVGFGIIDSADYSAFAKGLNIGLITMPFGGIIGGLTAGYKISSMLTDLLPIIILSLILIVCFVFYQQRLVTVTITAARILKAVIYIGLAAGAFEYLTGVVLIPGMTPVMEALEIVGGIALLLLGAFPLVTLTARILRKPLATLAGKLKINSQAAAGVIIALAHSVPVFNMLSKMDDRGKVMNVAFIVSASASFGAHLGFVNQAAPEMIAPMLAAKLSGGFSALLLSLWFTREKEF